MKKKKRWIPLFLLVFLISMFPAGKTWAGMDLVYKTGHFDIVMKLDGKSTTYRVYATASSMDTNSSHPVSWSMKLISGPDLGYKIKKQTNSLYDGATGYYVFEAVFEGGVPGYKLTWNKEETQFYYNGLYSEIEQSSDFSIRVDTNDLGCTNFIDGTFRWTKLVYDFTLGSYKQTVKVRYEKADGTWGDYQTVIDKKYKTGATVSWNSKGDKYDTKVYQKKSVSFKCPGKAYTKKVSIYRNTFPVSVTAGTGISSVSGGKTYRYGESCTISAKVKTGYHWKNWTGSKTAASQSYTFTVKEAKSFVANAVLNQSSLAVDPNGGTWEGSMRGQVFTQNYNTTKNIPDPVVLNYTAVFDAAGGTVTTQGGALAAYERITTGRRFSHWNQSGNAGSLSGKVFTFGSVDGGLGTLTAAYTGNYTVTPPDSVSYPGYIFQGWYTAPSGGTKISSPVTLTADVTYYAQWLPETPAVEYLSVAYNGGEGAAGSAVLDNGADGNGYPLEAGSVLTLYDNVDRETGEEHFTKEEEAVAFVDEDTGKEVKQTRTGKVAGWMKGEAESGRLYQKGAQEDTVALSDGIPGTLELTAVWDMGPVIEAYDLYYTLEEVQGGAITEEELLKWASVTDEVVYPDADGNLARKTVGIKAGTDETAGTVLKVWDYSPEDFTYFDSAGSVSETYFAQDSAGNVTKHKIIVHIVDTTPRDTDPGKGKVRFISKEYLWTLDENSIWVKNPEYAKRLKECLDNERVDQELSDKVFLIPESMRVIKPGSGHWKKEPEQVWQFSHKDVLRVQKYVTEHGIGNLWEKDGLKNFLKEFKDNRVK